MDFKVNLNAGVKVKLTDLGITILKAKHEDLNEYIRSRGGMEFNEFKLNLDEEGYFHTQLWKLMNDFGPFVKIGSKSPFHIEIIIKDGETAFDESTA